jgi:FkbM family methyltransferase
MKEKLFRAFASSLHRKGFRLQRFPRALQRSPGSELHLSLDHVIALYQARRPSGSPPFTLLQVGAYLSDGDDPLEMIAGERRAILVEPQPAAVAALRQRYAGDPSVEVVQAAVSSSDGRRAFFVVANDDGALPKWTQQLASFYRSHIEAFEKDAPGICARVRETSVEVLSFTTLSRRLGLDRLDLLMLDTEGHDFELLKAFPFAVMRPAIVCYEYIHLARASLEASVAMLVSHGYRVQLLYRDVVAVAE